MEEYVTIAEGARRLGVTTKRIQRAIRAGELSARRPHSNKAEIFLADLQAWFERVPIRPGKMHERLAALEAQVATLETEVHRLSRQLEASPVIKRKMPPEPDEEAPTNFVYLSDFCAQHFVPYQAAADLFPHLIRGQYITVHRRKQAILGAKGLHDFWVQMHTRSDFRSCDECPHPVSGQRV